MGPSVSGGDSGPCRIFWGSVIFAPFPITRTADSCVGSVLATGFVTPDECNPPASSRRTYNVGVFKKIVFPAYRPTDRVCGTSLRSGYRSKLPDYWESAYFLGFFFAQRAKTALRADSLRVFGGDSYHATQNHPTARLHQHPLLPTARIEQR